MRLVHVSLVLLGVVAAVVIALGVSMKPAPVLTATGTMTCPLCNAN